MRAARRTRPSPAIRRVRLSLAPLVLLACSAGAVAQGAPERDEATSVASGPRLEVTVIHALRSDAPPTLDPRLHDLAALVHEPPLARYNVFRLLDRTLLPLAEGRTAVDPLVNGRRLQVELVGRPDAGGDGRFRLHATIVQPGKAPFVQALDVAATADEPFFVGGQSYLGGSLLLELVVRPP